ncbi:MAG: stage III sporulation protein AF [Clostridiales bacterium]|nr:stage III sporulation protein AF [Clostridiales bacterium]
MSYIKNLAYFLIFSSFVGIILPNEKYKKYIDLCLGLVFVIMMLTPISHIIRMKEFPVNEFFEGLDNRVTKVDLPEFAEYETLQRELIEKAFNEQVFNQLKGICGKAGFELIESDARTSKDFSAIEKMKIKVMPSYLNGSSKERPFVFIDPARPYSRNVQDTAEIKKLKNAICDFYDMSTDNILITVTK